MKSFWIVGINPEPWSAGTPYRRGPHGVGLSKDPKLKMYQQAIIDEFPIQNPGVECLPKTAILNVQFYFWRSTLTGNVCDATNMQKATEDALQELIYVNDRNNHRVGSMIMEQTKTTEPAILITVEPLRGEPMLPERPERILVEKFQNSDWHQPETEMF